MRDAFVLFAYAFGVVLLSTRLIPWLFLRIILMMILLFFLVAYPFESWNTTPAARWPLTAILGLALVAEGMEFNRGPRRSVAQAALVPVAVLVPLLMVLTDWRCRVFLGQSSGMTRSRSFSEKGARVSISLLDSEDAKQAVNHRAGLRVVAGEKGSLSVERLDGGPAFCSPPISP
jgi:hypothetical protein